MLDGIDEFEDDAGGTVFRDVILLALAGFVVVVMLLLPHLNPPTKQAEAALMPPGNVVVEVRWPDGVDADIDLWVAAPNDAAVGYSNKGSAKFNLLRDDRGQLMDATELNYEVSYSRGIDAGEYTVNLHLYATRGNATGRTIPADVVVSVKGGDTASTTKQILARRVALIEVDEELTVFRFKLGSDGQLKAGSVHSLFRPLRENQKL
ncbi:MAG: hypothetical protein HOK61_09015 [Alphaproteobacteria bacterium]|jgi:hypothetical protein|nr:hypothetical protein [Alphaproteobacteria bacterium]